MIGILGQSWRTSAKRCCCDQIKAYWDIQYVVQQIHQEYLALSFLSEGVDQWLLLVLLRQGDHRRAGEEELLKSHDSGQADLQQSDWVYPGILALNTADISSLFLCLCPNSSILLCRVPAQATSSPWPTADFGTPSLASSTSLPTWWWSWHRYTLRLFLAGSNQLAEIPQNSTLSPALFACWHGVL